MNNMCKEYLFAFMANYRRLIMYVKYDSVIDVKGFRYPHTHKKKMEGRVISVQLADREFKVDPAGFLMPRAAHQFYTAKL